MEQRMQVERVVFDDNFALVSDLQTNWHHKDGHLLPVSIWAARFPEMDLVGRLAIGIVVDLTRTKALEEQFRMAQKMEVLGRLAGGVAHDFNNLMVVVGGYSQLLIDRGGEFSDAHSLECLNEIANAARRASELTRQLLAFGRRQILQPRALDLNLLISDLARMLRRLIGEDINLTLNLQEDAGAILADPGQMEQVIVNLVVNARDAMPKGGRLEIATCTVREPDNPALPSNSGPYLKLVVSDTGDGIPPEIREQIFEPFFTTKRPGEGTGLGLATVYGIVRQSGGVIVVTSKPGHGTAFSIYMPITSLKSETPIQKTSTSLDGTETILLCDDQAPVCKLIGEMLSAHGYQVLPCFNATDATNIAREHSGKIDLLLTDVIMSEASGVELARRLLEIRPDVKVLYMSAHSGAVLAEQTGIPQDVAFIEKPFTPESLARKVRETLDDN
jgi:signal transduction histidine kinase